MSTVHPTEGAADDAYASLLRHPEIQTSFPSLVPPKIPDWLTSAFQFLNKHSTLLGWIFWAIIAGALLFLAIALIRQYWPALLRWFPAKRDSAEPQKVEWHPTVAQARKLLDESDTLAAQGQYSEAIHLLLLRSIEDIESKWPRMVRPTFTSREIGAIQAIPNTARVAFVKIARVVERAIFAGYAASASDFQACRQEYEEFALKPHNI
jgi:hypothetical protein